LFGLLEVRNKMFDMALVVWYNY